MIHVLIELVKVSGELECRNGQFSRNESSRASTEWYDTYMLSGGSVIRNRFQGLQARFGDIGVLE